MDGPVSRRKQRAQRGEGEPETFAFLGFTHQCEVTQSGGFQVKRTTVRKRMEEIGRAHV